MFVDVKDISYWCMTVTTIYGAVHITSLGRGSWDTARVLLGRLSGLFSVVCLPDESESECIPV